VIIAADIRRYRELKLRLLNGSHTFSCGLAHLAGFHTVKDAMNDAAFSAYITHLMMNEICSAIVDDEITVAAARDFAGQVLDRYRNPHIDHQWLSITVQFSSKMQMRNVPTILKYFERNGAVPEAMALGFAAHLLFMRSEKDHLGKYWGESSGRKFQIMDDNAGWYYEKWKSLPARELVRTVLGDEEKWGTDLTTLPGFENAVYTKLEVLLHEGAAAVLQKAGTMTAAA
jgi:tagaturonate reductase